MEKYKDKSLQELNDLFFELGNEHFKCTKEDNKIS